MFCKHRNARKSENVRHKFIYEMFKNNFILFCRKLKSLSVFIGKFPTISEKLLSAIMRNFYCNFFSLPLALSLFLYDFCGVIFLLWPQKHSAFRVFISYSSSFLIAYVKWRKYWLLKILLDCQSVFLSHIQIELNRYQNFFDDLRAFDRNIL